MKKLLLILIIFGNLFTLHGKSGYAQEGFIGEIRMFSGNFAPRNWAFCEGQLLPISSYNALFSILGTTYGGDGRTTFALPDLRGRVVIHPGTGPGLSSYNPGEKGGYEKVTLQEAQLPSHKHRFPVQSKPAIEKTPDIASKNETKAYSLTASKPARAIETSKTGGNQPVEIRPPYIAVHFIICVEGTYPARH